MSPEGVRGLVKPVLDFGNAAYDLSVRSGRDDLAAELGKQASLWKSAEVTVVVTGRTGTGKTSLLDSLLSRPVFGESRVEPTRTHVVVRHADEPEILVHRADSDEPERIPPVMGVPVPDGNVCSIEVGVPDPLLEPGLRLIDTPGLDAYEPGQSQLTRAAVGLADTLVFVTDAGTPLSQPELDFLADATSRVAGMVVALARTDVARDWRATSVRDAADAGDLPQAERLFGRAGIHDLRAKIQASIETREAMRLANILRLGRSVLTHLEESERGRLGNNMDSEERERCVAQQNTLAEEFSSATATWRQDLAHEFQDLAYEVGEDVTRHVAALQTRYETLLRDSGDSVGRLAELVPADMDASLRAAWFEIAGLLGRRLEEISATMAERFNVSGFEIVFDDLSIHDRMHDITTQRAAPERHSSATFEYMKAGWPALGLGSIALRLSPLIGLTGAAALVATPLLAAASLVAGGVIGKRTLDISRATRDRQEINRYVSAVLSQAKADMATGINRQLAAIRQHMQQRIDSVLRERKRDLSIQMQNLKDMKGLVSTSRKAEEANTKRRLARIERLAQRASQLEEALAGGRTVVGAEGARA